MSQDEDARLRQKLKTLWKALADVFEPSVTAGECETPHPEAKAKDEDQHQQNGKIATRKGYSGHWNTFAFGGGIFGGGIFGASFNFYTAKDFSSFWVLLGMGSVLILFSIAALALHDRRELDERNLIQARADRNARIDAVLADFRVIFKETEYQHRINAETFLLLQCSPFRLKDNDELRELCERIVAFKLPNPIRPFRNDPDPLAFLRYRDEQEITIETMIPATYFYYRGSFGWK